MCMSLLETSGNGWADVNGDALDPRCGDYVRRPMTRSPDPALRVLIVEDNEDVGDMLALLLETHGCSVVLRRDGRSGLEAARTHGLDLAILDLGLPELDGYELARGLRESPAGRDLLIVALSGYTQPEHVRRARDVGFDRHLPKPIGDTAITALLGLAESHRDELAKGHRGG